jgi:hypothetical protein
MLNQCENGNGQSGENRHKKVHEAKKLAKLAMATPRTPKNEKEMTSKPFNPEKWGKKSINGK